MPPLASMLTALRGNRTTRTGQSRVTYRWIGRMVPFIRPRPGNLLLAFAAVTAGGALGAGLLLVQREVLDLAVAGRTGQMLAPIVALLVLGVLVYGVQRVGAYRELKAANDAQFLVYEAVHRRMQDIDADAQNLPTGQLAARLNSDIEALSRAVALLPRFAGAALSTAVAVVLMLMLSPMLGAATLIVAPLLVLVTRRSRRVVQPATWQAQQREAEVAQLASEAIYGVRVVKALGQEQREIDRMTEASAGLYRARLAVVRLQALFQPLMESLSGVVQVVVIIVGGYLMLRGQMTLGTFLAFSSFSGQLVGMVRWFADTVVGLQEAGVCAGRVLDLLDLPPAVVEAPDATPLPPAWGELRLTDVSYGYGDGPEVLSGLSLTVRAGETVAIVGATGSGKSTVVKLLARFHDPRTGGITVDGTDLRMVTLASLRSQIGVVFDEPVLFTGTIRDNITFGRPEADDEEVRAAAVLAGAHDFISALPDGDATTVGERGYTLSGGQRQRIALARALLTRPRLLLLDDATGGVDPTRERRIYRQLKDDHSGRTMVFVGYRASTVALADRVVVLDRGRVVAQGTHESLLGSCRLYRDLIEPEPPSERTATVASDPTVRRQRRPVWSHRSAWSHRAVSDPVPAPEPGPVRTVNAVDRPVPAGLEWLPGALDRSDPSRRPQDFTVRRLLWPHRAMFAAVLALLITQTGLGVLNPYVTRQAVDGGVLAHSAHGLGVAAVVIALMSVAGLIITPLTMNLAGRMGQRVIVAVRLRLWSHLVRLPISYYERQKAGRLLTRVVNDVEAFSGFVTTGLANALVQGLTAAGVLIAMLLVEPLLGALVGVSVVPFVLLLRLLNKRIIAAYLGAREQVAEANAALQENLAGIREAQSFGQQERQHAHYRTMIRRYLDSRLDAERLIAASAPVVSFLSGMAGALVLGVGALMLARGHLTPGELIAFVLWSGAFFPPIVQIGLFFADVKRVEVSTMRIQQTLAEPLGPAPTAFPVRPGRVHGELSLRGVRFQYPGTTNEILSGVDLRVPAGSTIALVGATGVGKSTIFKLLARFYDPTAGQVLLDGVDLRVLDPAAFRERLGYLPQEPHLFSGTVHDNIAYGCAHASEAEVRRAAEAVGAHEGIMALPGGYDHVVGERGGALSAGLRQLVCLARAYLMDPAVVLLDEATARLDLATEARVLDAIREVARGRTTVMIAHRLQTAMIADHIAVVNEGRVAEWGSHDQLMADDGQYAKLYRSSVLAPVPV